MSQQMSVNRRVPVNECIDSTNHYLKDNNEYVDKVMNMMTTSSAKTQQLLR